MAGKLGDVFGWTRNPGYQALASNRNALMNLGAGLASGNSWSEGLANGIGAVPQGAARDDAWAQVQAEEAKKQETLNQTTEWLRQNGQASLLAAVESGALDPGRAFELALAPKPQATAPDPADSASGRAQLAQQYGLQGDALSEYVLTGKLPGGNQTARAGVGQPLFGRNKQTGAIEPWQSMTDGTMVNIANPQADPTQYDFNPGIAAAERATGGGDAKTAVAARAALPAAEQAYALTQQALASIGGNKAGVEQNFGNILGFPTQKAPAYPGSSLADLRNQVDQLSGTAFLQIRQALKGAGQVTDYEGQKGEIALNRMRAALDSGSKSDFDAALVDYQTAIDNGLSLLREAANGGYSAGAPRVTGQQPGGTTSSGLSWSVSP